jgi:hypothetical protein
MWCNSTTVKRTNGTVQCNMIRYGTLHCIAVWYLLSQMPEDLSPTTLRMLLTEAVMVGRSTTPERKGGGRGERERSGGEEIGRGDR